MWEEVVRRRDKCDIASWDQLFYLSTHLVISISNYEIRQRLKKAPCFGGTQPRLGQGTAIHRRARQMVTRDGEDLSFEWKTARTERCSRKFAVLILINRRKNFTSLVSLPKVQQYLHQFPTSHFLDLSWPLPPNFLSPYPTSYSSPSLHHNNSHDTAPPPQRP